MRLNEMFSPLGNPDDKDQDINWIQDLKFFMDHEERILQRYIYRSIKKHIANPKSDNAYKLYIPAIINCIKDYCNKFEITEPDSKFPKASIIELAKSMASEQETFIKNGDYKV